MALTAKQTLTAVSAATETNIHTAVGDEQLIIRITNQSGGAGTIDGLSLSTTTATQQPSGDLIGTAFPIADGSTIELTGIVMTTANEFLVLNSSVAVNAVVSGWGDV